MGYRSSEEATSARIAALEHEVLVLRAAALAAETAMPDVLPAPDGARPPNARERELTHELAAAREEIASLRRAPAARTAWPRLAWPAALGVAALLVAMTMLLAVTSAPRARPVLRAPDPTPAAAPAAGPSAAEPRDTALRVTTVEGTDAVRVGDGCALYATESGDCRASVWCDGLPLVPAGACTRDLGGGLTSADGALRWQPETGALSVALEGARVSMRVVTR